MLLRLNLNRDEVGFQIFLYRVKFAVGHVVVLRTSVTLPGIAPNLRFNFVLLRFIVRFIAVDSDTCTMQDGTEMCGMQYGTDICSMHFGTDTCRPSI